MKCKICNQSTIPFGEAEILHQHRVHYFRCENCGFIQTETPYWLDEAYSEAITRSDIGLLDRNLEMMRKTRDLISICFDPERRFIDYGGGYGVFVRLMRDQGFDFYRHDPICKNLFAQGFEAQAGINYELLTAWEVFEHLVDPMAEIERMLSYSQNLFFSTILLPEVPSPLGEWWYYGLEHGQHVAFYSPQTLRVIAQKHNLALIYSDGATHLMGRKKIHPMMISFVLEGQYKFFRRLFSFRSRASLLEKDFQQIRGQPGGESDASKLSRR